MLQDGNYNVVALLGQAGQVLEQYVWDPYGTPVVKHTSATPAPVNRVGHQGLFWHSLDGSATFNIPDPAANPTATGLYYNRNRWYAPHLGRFLQRDPNESAMLVLDTLARNGQLAAGLLNAFDAASHFGSGMNLYGYAGSNPITGADPAGLYDPFAEVDNWIDDRVGNALYTLGTLNEAANLGLKASLEVASVLLGLDVFQSVYLVASGQGGFYDAMNIVVSVTPIGRLGKAVGQIARASKLAAKGGKASARLVRHHTVPKAVLKKLNAEVAADGFVRGKKGAPNIWRIPEKVHKTIHSGPRGGHWNRRWWEELGGEDNACKATVEQVREIRNTLVREFGLEYKP